jgi:predicted O-methyltransferase YrrM
MVITDKPAWFDLWHSGKDSIRITQDDLWPATGMYGKYVSHVNLDLKLYSGLISLPPNTTYIDQFLEVLQKQPLAIPHDGRKDMCEQGVVAAAFQKFVVEPIPLYEFPFGRAFEDHIDYGIQGNQDQVWGYHFGNSFILDNPHFHRLAKAGIIYSKPKDKWLSQLRYLFHFSGERIRKLSERFRWLGNIGQWGVPGWAISGEIATIICKEAQAYAGKKVLEIGTSRGHLSAMLASLGCKLTSVDHEDRDAAQNLGGLNVTVIVKDAVEYLISTDEVFDLIVVDVHGNTPKDWARLKDPLLDRLKPGGKLVIDNVALYLIPEWKEETGVQWFLDQLPKSWPIKINTTVAPGVATVIKGPL